MSNQLLFKQISSQVGKGVQIKKSLCFYNPEEVYNGLIKNKDIISWHKFILNKYQPPKKDILLIYPCSTVKPYHKSRSYKQLYNHLELLNGTRKKIQLMTISEPFGLVPEEYYDKFQWYDCPGLFEWWCKKHDQEFDNYFLDKSLELLADNIGRFLKQAKRKKTYHKIIGFVRTYSSSLDKRHDHTHRRMLELASEKYGIEIEILPNKKQVRSLVEKRGSFAWDMYGVAHTYMLKTLIKKLQSN